MWKSIVGATALLGLMAGNAGAATIIPVGSETVEGNSANGFPFFTPIIARYQQVWDGSLFGNETIRISAISFRIDEDSFVSSFGPTQTGQIISLSTTTRAVDNLSITPNLNVGVDSTIVASNPTLSGTAVPNQVNPFNVTIAFNQLFTFDPTAGNLLLDVVGSALTASIDAVIDENDGTSRFLEMTNGDRSTNTLGLVAKFDFEPVSTVPVPAALPLLTTALAVFGLLRLRRSNTA